MEERLPRKLAAILYADVAGYSRLTGEDEDATHRVLSDYLDLISTTIESHGGQVMHYAGDAVLAKFEAVVDTMSAAIEIQNSLRSRNQGSPETRRVEFRIGVNSGDVIEDRGDIYGDGVNVAARLESLADRGGICISDAVRSALGKKLGLDYQDMGEQEVKNIEEPVRAYRVTMGRVKQPESGTTVESGSAQPSIAVLPFTNMSGDVEQEYFTDGLTEDIITELSRFHELFVISRNSTFVYKGQAINAPSVAHELGVRFVLAGSVRKAGSRVRITVQLIDADSDRHVWAERYDRQLEDIFDLQDEMTSAIAATLPGRIESAERERVKREPTESLAVYECVLEGKVLHHRSNRDDNQQALQLLERAIKLDPKYAHAHAWRACVLGQSWTHGWCEDREETWNEVVEELETSLSLSDNDSDVHRILAAVNITRGDHERATHHQQRGLSLNPNYDLIVVQQGELLTWLGQASEGVEWILKAMRLNPHHPERFWSHLGRAYFVDRQYSNAVDALKRVSTPDYQVHALLVACYAQMDDEAAANEHAGRLLKENPEFTVSSYINTLHYAQRSDRDHHREALLKSDLPVGNPV